jgi:hypothetical protein
MPTVLSNLIIYELFHGLVALPFAYLIYKKTKSIKYAFFVMLFTYLIDLDHLIDYFSYYGYSFNLYNFSNVDYFTYSGKAYVVFHAWEWVAAFGLLAYLRKRWNSIFTIITFALLPHLIVDTLTLKSVLIYSIIYRIITNFALL